MAVHRPPTNHSGRQTSVSPISGSRPACPPYHYEYTIRIGPGLQGVIEYQPDYAFPSTPIWMETFDLKDEDLEKVDIYNALPSLVPGATWQKLEAQRKQYMQDFVAGQETMSPQNTTRPTPSRN